MFWISIINKRSLDLSCVLIYYVFRILLWPTTIPAVIGGWQCSWWCSAGAEEPAWCQVEGAERSLPSSVANRPVTLQWIPSYCGIQVNQLADWPSNWLSWGPEQNFVRNLSLSSCACACVCVCVCVHRDLYSRSVQPWESGTLTIRPRTYLRNGAAVTFISPPLVHTAIRSLQ